jgi:hypothetical protein
MHTTPAGNRQGADRAKNPVQPPNLVDVGIDDEANLPRAGQLQHHGVHPGQVIREQEKSPRGQLFPAIRVDAIDDAGEQDADPAHEAADE